MANPKKSKVGGGKGKKGKQERKTSQQDDGRDTLAAMAPMDRVAAVAPFWQTQTPEQRIELLTISLEDLSAYAKQQAARAARATAQHLKETARVEGEAIDTLACPLVNLEPSFDEVLEEGVARSQTRSTWKVWRWSETVGDQEPKEYFDAESFRQFVEERLPTELQHLLLKEEGKAFEKPAEEQLRKRMTELLQKIHASNRQMQEEVTIPRRTSRSGRAAADAVNIAVRDSNIDLITLILEAMEREHEFLYHAVLFPVTACVIEALPEASRETRANELYFEDLEKMAPEDVARIAEWLTEKVDAFSSKVKPEAKDVEDEEEEAIGDVDLFTLTESGDALTVNAKWLQHLEERLLGEDGHPRKAVGDEDPHRMGLVLEWVFGTIVSTAEKARDCAKRGLGSRVPTVAMAQEQFTQALHDQNNWEMRAKQARELLTDMLRSRKDAVELAKQYDIRPVVQQPACLEDIDELPPLPAELPDWVVVEMLRHELLLVRAKLHGLSFEHLMGERRLRNLKNQLRQGEPEFERLKRELEDVKNAPRGLEGTFRTAAEMERHRAQLADAAIEEQLEVQTQFREHGARLQSIYDKRQRLEMDMAKKEGEMKQLQGWKNNVASLLERFEQLIKPASNSARSEGDSPRGASPPTSNAGDAPITADDAEAPAAWEGTLSSPLLAARDRAALLQGVQAAQQEPGLQKLRVHFFKDIRRQLYSDEDDRQLYNTIIRELHDVDRKLEEGRAALHHLEMHVINVACDDPGCVIGSQLALPLLQERLDSRAIEFAARKAAEAEEQIIRMEEEKAERERLEREKRAKQKQKAKEKVKSEKERLAAERLAEQQAEAAKRAQEEEARRTQEEEIRRKRLEELDRIRKEEEALMEARRKELLSEENGYWKQRMAAEQPGPGLDEGSSIPSTTSSGEGGNAATAAGSDEEPPSGDGPGERPAAASRRAVSETSSSPRAATGHTEMWESASGRRLSERRAGAQAEPRAAATADVANFKERRSMSAERPKVEGTDEVEAAATQPASVQPAQSTRPQPQPAKPQPAQPSTPVQHVAPRSTAQPPVQAPPVQLPPPAVVQQPVEGPMGGGVPPPVVMPRPALPHLTAAGHALAGPPLPIARPPMGMAPVVMPPGPGMMPPPPGWVPPEGAHSEAPPGFVPGSTGGEPMQGPSSSGPPLEGPRPGGGAMLPGPPPGAMFSPGMGPMAGAPHPGMMPMPPPHMPHPPGAMVGPPYAGGGPPHGAPMVPHHPPYGGPPFHMYGPGPYAPPPGMPSMMGVPHSGVVQALPKTRSTPLRAAATPFVPANLRGAASVPPDAAARPSVEDAQPSAAAAAAPAVADAPSSPSGSVERESDSTQHSEASGAVPEVVEVAAPAVPSPPLGEKAGGRRRVLKAGGLLVEGLEEDLKRLKLVRGLINEDGQSNCFLNVIIQSLWHLACFREAMLAAPMSDTEPVPSADRRVAIALQNIFQAFANAPEDIHIEDLQEGASNDGAPAPTGGWAVSPTELREALSSLDHDRLAQHFAMGDMHDAAEVLGAVYQCLHAAELGVGASDPTLPTRLPGDGVDKRAPTGPHSMVQRLFGMEVQAPAVEEDGGADGFLPTRRSASGSWQRGKGGRGDRTPTAAEGRGDVLLFTKYFHLVPTSSLRLAAEQAPPHTRFEEVLQGAEAAAPQAPQRRPSQQVVLLRTPSVFTLSLVWDSPRATKEAVAGAMRAVQPTVDLAGLFSLGPEATPAGPYYLRCLVCYIGHHYLSYALSEELHQWLLLDDTVIKLVGSWEDVLETIVRESHQPSVLFYEAA